METEVVRTIFAIAFWSFVVFAPLLMLFVWSEEVRFRSWKK